MPASMHIEGLEELLRRIQTLQKMREVTAALLAGGAHLKTQMQVYPPQAHLTRKSVYGQSFQSDRQRRWFFWALARGALTVPYRRGQSAGSRNLKQQWTVVASNSGLTVEIGNSTPYGPLMQSAVMQGRMAKAAGWQTDQQVLDRDGPKAVDFVKNQIQQTLDGA